MILGSRGMIADREISNLLRRSKIFPQGVELAYTYSEVPILKFHFVEKVIHKNTYL